MRVFIWSYQSQGQNRELERIDGWNGWEKKDGCSDTKETHVECVTCFSQFLGRPLSFPRTITQVTPVWSCCGAGKINEHLGTDLGWKNRSAFLGSNLRGKLLVFIHLSLSIYHIIRLIGIAYWVRRRHCAVSSISALGLFECAELQRGQHGC